MWQTMLANTGLEPSESSAIGTYGPPDSPDCNDGVRDRDFRRAEQWLYLGLSWDCTPTVKPLWKM